MIFEIFKITKIVPGSLPSTDWSWEKVEYKKLGKCNLVVDESKNWERDNDLCWRWEITNKIVAAKCQDYITCKVKPRYSKNWMRMGSTSLDKKMLGWKLATMMNAFWVWTVFCPSSLSESALERYVSFVLLNL